MTLKEAIAECEAAMQCVRENRGTDKELAREALASCMEEVLVPAIVDALLECSERDVYRIAKVTQKALDATDS